eukprot:Filipodium_phascolosomae@DN2159_c0_g2_i1.p1
MAEGTFIVDDGYIPEALRQDLMELAAKLENKLPRDYHPGSDKKVLDLVHPSLFPLIIGVSHKVGSWSSSLSRKPWQLIIGGGQPVKHEPRIEEYYSYDREYLESEKYCWLPTDFTVGDKGSVKLCGYINNINPVEYPEAYNTIPKILEKFIPLWEKVLTRLTANSSCRISLSYDWYAPKEKKGKSLSDGINKNEEDAEEDEDDYDRLVYPTLPQNYDPPTPMKIVSLKGRSLQVVVKMANIELHPNDPEYSGGAWHVEGMRNENIIATGLYYYAIDNITESRLNFRVPVEDPSGGGETGSQDENFDLKRIYGLDTGDELNRNVGYFVAKEGRCLAFPNTLQHRVGEFKIRDGARPAYRKILAFFLIHPCTHITSTSEIPPQQINWFKYALRIVVSKKSSPNSKKKCVFPECVIDMIGDYLDFPLSWEEATVHRNKLMSERKAVQKEHNKDAYEREFSLCEH